jgi:hypothetical protein
VICFGVTETFPPTSIAQPGESGSSITGSGYPLTADAVDGSLNTRANRRVAEGSGVRSGLAEAPTPMSPQTPARR